MSRVALLIGVSKYPPGLNPLLRAQKDVEVMRRVLRQPQFGFEMVECYCDASLQQMQEGIETFFKNRIPDDQVLFLFTGYGIQDRDGKLYFATPETAPDSQGRLIKSRAIPASFVRDVMNSSPARHQVMILDCHLQQGFDQVVQDNNPIDVFAQLDGRGRVILAASIFTHPAVETSDIDVWSYTRYLIEGIETSVADRDSDGLVSAEDLHEYARRKMAIAAPAMNPQIYGSPESARFPLLTVPVHDARVIYHKVLDDLVERGQTDATATMLLEHRSLLDEIKHGLKLSPQEAEDIEARSLRPLRDYRQRLQSYQEKFSETKLGNVGPNHQNNDDLRRYRQALGLTNDDTAAIEAVPDIVQQQQQREQYQRNLVKYEQVLLAVMQRQYPIAEGDRRLLHHLQTSLQLRDNDVQMIEAELATRLHRRGTPPPDPPTTPASVTQPPAELYPTQPGPPSPSASGWTPAPSHQPPNAGVSPQPVPASYSPSGTSPPPGQPASPPPGQPASPPPLAQSPPSPSPVPPVDTNQGPVTTVQPSDATANPPASAPMSKSPNHSRWSYGVFIIPALLLAAMIGVGVALWSSSRNTVNPFNQSTMSPGVDSQNPPSPVQQAAGDINLGVTAHGIGDFNGAIRYYNQAIKVLTDICQSNKNNQPSSCQLLAKAYSNRSYSYFRLQNYNQALEDANSAVVLDSNLVEARINLANARFMQGDRAEAIQDYNRALELKPSPSLQAGIYNNRGNVYFSQNSLQTALKDYDQALALRNDYADAYFNRGLVHERQNNINNAISDFQNAAKFYREQNALDLAQEAEKRATNLQQNAPKSTALPPG